MPVLKVTRADGSLLAVVFGYACHCTVLDFNKFCGDYAGFAQVDLEKRHPGAQAMFVAGCGGDQNPIPRRALDLAVGYGKQLAESVEKRPRRAARDDRRPDRDRVRRDRACLRPPADQRPDRARRQVDNFYIASRARHLLETIESRGQLESDVSLSGRGLAARRSDLGFPGGRSRRRLRARIKRNLGSSHTWVSAYCNDVMAYIPSYAS